MKPEKPEAKPNTPKTPQPAAETKAAGVRRQRQHIKDLTGEDPLRAGIAD
jgi:hypothetical protein